MTKDSETSAEDFFPDRKSLKAFREAAADCQACDLWKRGTQTVFGEGARRAEIVFVGEQPGNEEDLSGKPFVGPAGRLLDEALIEAGIDRTQTYVTNVVKHFKWEPRGKRRIHKKPNAEKLPLAVHGSKPRLVWLNRKSSFVSALPPLRHCSDQNSKSANSAANSLNPL
jgi:uracil-DNA glycosylase family protein